MLPSAMHQPMGDSVRALRVPAPDDPMVGSDVEDVFELSDGSFGLPDDLPESDSMSGE